MGDKEQISEKHAYEATMVNGIQAPASMQVLDQKTLQTTNLILQTLISRGANPTCISEITLSLISNFNINTLMRNYINEEEAFYSITLNTKMIAHEINRKLCSKWFLYGIKLADVQSLVISIGTIVDNAYWRSYSRRPMSDKESFTTSVSTTERILGNQNQGISQKLYDNVSRGV